MPKRRHISGEEYARQQALKKERIAKQNHECFLQERQERLYGKADSATLYEQYSRSEESAVEKEKQRMRQSILEKERREAAERERQEAAAVAEAARKRKVLVCGDVRGNVAKLFGTLEAQEKKVGPFDALLCVGTFLPEAQSDEESALAYINGSKQAALECYFVDPSAGMLQAAPRGCTLGSGLHFLGAYGVREVCGLRVAFLSGHYDPEVYERADVDFVGGAFTSKAVGELIRRAARDVRQRGVDLLLTCGWPAGLDKRLDADAQQPPQLEGLPSWELVSSTPVAELCYALEPRYHLFGSANLFYQRPPFKTPRRGHACRCIGLGQVGNKQQKWLHALALSPMVHMKREELMQQTAAATVCPFPAPARRQGLETAEGAASVPAAAAAAAVVAQTPGPASVAESPTVAEPAAAAAVEEEGERLDEETAKEPLPARALAALTAGDLVLYRRLAEGLQTRLLTCVPGHRGAEEARSEDPRRKAAEVWLRREPSEGMVRFTFRDEGDLGLRLSQDVPPWVLEVRDGTPSARKAPRVPLGGVVVAINGYEITPEVTQEPSKMLERRPAILDIQWPRDLRPPVVKYA